MSFDIVIIFKYSPIRRNWCRLIFDWETFCTIVLISILFSKELRYEIAKEQFCIWIKPISSNKSHGNVNKSSTDIYQINIALPERKPTYTNNNAMGRQGCQTDRIAMDKKFGWLFYSMAWRYRQINNSFYKVLNQLRRNVTQIYFI